MENKGLNKRTGEILPPYHLMCTDAGDGKKEAHHKLMCRRISKHYRPNDDTENTIK